MPKTYIDASPETLAMLDGILDEHFPFVNRLEHDLSIRVRFVLSDNDAAPLTKGGWPCEALVTKVPLKMRAAGGPDVLIEIDGSVWHALTEPQRLALLHHELEHVELVELKRKKNDDGETYYTCKLDSLQRPVVSLKKHDYECGGFARIHDLYGDDSPEARQLALAESRLEQRVFSFSKAV